MKLLFMTSDCDLVYDASIMKRFGGIRTLLWNI